MACPELVPGAGWPVIAVEEYIDINPWHGLRFGALEPVEAGAIERYPVARALYDVEMSNAGLHVKRDNRPLFTTDAPAEIRHVRFSRGRVDFEVRARQPVKVKVANGEAREFAPGTERGSAPYS